jgi:hypothetical protein
MRPIGPSVLLIFIVRSNHYHDLKRLATGHFGPLWTVQASTSRPAIANFARMDSPALAPFVFATTPRVVFGEADALSIYKAAF